MTQGYVIMVRLKVQVYVTVVMRAKVPMVGERQVKLEVLARRIFSIQVGSRIVIWSNTNIQRLNLRRVGGVTGGQREFRR